MKGFYVTLAKPRHWKICMWYMLSPWKFSKKLFEGIIIKVLMGAL